MIITTIEELRLAAPSHAYDTIDGLIGYIDNSERSFLEDKLGTPLYNALQQWYDENPTQRTSVQDYQTGYYNRLLLLAQRCVGFDALGRSAGMQTVSANNAGLNQMTADDYPTATKDNIQTYRQTCFQEAMRSLDILLATLEQWVTEVADAEKDSERDVDPDQQAIVEKWSKSRYYYLSASMLLPTAVVLQQYMDFQESREKFIRMLPDLRFIQEEIIANAIGEDLLMHFVDVAVHELGDAQPITTRSPLQHRIIRDLRRAMVSILQERTKVLKLDKDQRQQAHDDGVRKLGDACRFIQQQQQPLLVAMGATEQQVADLAAGRITTADLPDECQPLIASPLFVAPVPPAAATESPVCGCTTTATSANDPTAINNSPGAAAFFTDPLL